MLLPRVPQPTLRTTAIDMIIYVVQGTLYFYTEKYLKSTPKCCTFFSFPVNQPCTVMEILHGSSLSSFLRSLPQGFPGQNGRVERGRDKSAFNSWLCPLVAGDYKHTGSLRGINSSVFSQHFSSFSTEIPHPRISFSPGKTRIVAPSPPDSLHFLNRGKENQADLEDSLHAFEGVYVNRLA